MHKRELLNFYSSPSVIRMIMSRWMRLTGNVARIETKRNAYSVFGESQKERDR
jgi:hypothetical protein